MLAVIFEVTPKHQGKAIYFEMAQALKASLTNIDGFISIERFQSLSDPDTFLSLSFWQNETAIKQWKEHLEHRTRARKTNPVQSLPNKSRQYYS